MLATTPTTANPRPADPGAAVYYTWANWRSATILILAVLVLRLLYITLLSPYDLIADEAHYWEWSRRLDLSYYTKGPGVAWLIALPTAIFGDHAWAVRLSAPFTAALTALALAALAASVSRDERAAFFTAALVTLIPAHLVLGLIMSVDGPYLACWSLAALLAWRALARGSSAALAAAGFVAGLGFLVKYTILLLPLGVLLAAVVLRRPLRAARAGRPLRLRAWVGAAIAFLLAASPVLVWNHREGWPTVKHLLVHLNLAPANAETLTPAAPRAYDPAWTLEFLAAQVGLIGPALGLIAIAAALTLRRRRLDRPRSVGRAYLLLVAAPILLFYLAVSFVADAEGNWTLAGYATLLALVGSLAPAELQRRRERALAWRALPAPRPWSGILRREPESGFQILWHWTVGVGLVVALFTLHIAPLAHLPWIGPKIPIWRVQGERQRAAVLDQLLDGIELQEGARPPIFADTYGRASLAAFYARGNPITYCARMVMGGQPSQYDYFHDTRLHPADPLSVTPSLRGRTIVLLGGPIDKWLPAFESVEDAGSLHDPSTLPAGHPRHEHVAGKHRVFIGRGYRGFQGAPRP